MIGNISLALVYSGAYVFSYVYYLHEYFEYLHFPLREREGWSWFFPVFFVLVPAAIMGSIKNAASVFSSFVYILIYVPTILTMQLAYAGGFDDLLMAQLTFFVSMIALFLVSKIDFKAASRNSGEREVFGKILLIASIFSTVYLIAIYGDNLKFVSLEEVYLHRSENSEIGASGLIGYVIAWTNAFFVPVLIAVGVSNRNFIYILTGCLASVVIYMAEASKGALLMPVILYMLHFLIKKFGVINIFRSIAMMLSLIMVVGTLYVLKYDLSAPLTMFVAIVIMRVVATGGILNTIYFEYFQNNPKTYLSQYSLLDNVFQTYPYAGEPIGYVIGRYYVAEGMNVNANFWASDGLMNAGLLGVLCVTVIVCAFLVILNFRAKNCVLELSSLLIIIFFATAANTSFIQALWSGGGLLLLVSLKYLRKNNEVI